MSSIEQQERRGVVSPETERTLDPTRLGDHLDRLYRAAWALCGSREDAEDLVQETYLRAWRAYDRFEGRSSLRTWLYRIALREASNQRRWWSRHKKQEITIDSPYESDSEDEGNGLCLSATLADHSDSPFDYAAQAEIRERVEAALRQLPEAFRNVVILREIEGFAYEEISEILDVNLGTVKSRLTRGRSALRMLLNRDSVIASTNPATVPLPETSKTAVTQ